jgi:hypothetical protein
MGSKKRVASERGELGELIVKLMEVTGRRSLWNEGLFYVHELGCIQ